MKKLIVLIAFLTGVMNLAAQDRADVSLTGSVFSMSSATNSKNKPGLLYVAG